MYFADICVELGQPSDAARPGLSRVELASLYRKHGIAWGLAYHAVAREYDAYTGNQRMLQAIAGHDIFHPLPTIALNRHPADDPVLAQVEQLDPKIIIVFPKEHGYRLEKWVVDAWMKELTRRNVTILIHMNQTDWSQVAEFAKNYAQTRIIILGTRYHDYAMLHSALTSFPNLMLDISQHHIFDGMRRLVRPYGSGRFFFGSGLPLYSPGSPKFQLLHGGLDSKEINDIAHGNLEQLLKVPASRDTTEAEAIIPCPIIDMHAHTGAWPRYGMQDTPHNEVIAAVQRAGVQMACVNNIFEKGAPAGNDVTARFTANQPGRFFGVAKINPFAAGGAIMAELERCRIEHGFRGIKIYPPHDQLPVDDLRYLPAYQFADRHGWSVLYHGAPEEIPALAERYTRAIFICGHSVDVPAAQEWARKYANVYLEICASTRFRKTWLEALRDAPAEKILFGSDFTLLDPAAMAGAVLDAVDEPSLRYAILRGNASRILGLER